MVPLIQHPINISNPYQSPTIAADDRTEFLAGGPSPLYGIIAVAIGATVGGFVATAAIASWFGRFPMEASNRQVIVGLFLALPVGCVFGGLLAKWCLLQIMRKR